MQSRGEPNISVTERLPRATGRPRKLSATQDILRATLAILEEEGFAGLTIEAIARRANVGRPALYRRWPSKEAIVEAAFEDVFSEGIPVPDTGVFRTDLTLTMQMLILFFQSPIGAIVTALIGEGLRDSRWQKFSTQFGRARREKTRQIFTRAIARGEIPADTNADLVLDMLLSPVMLGHLVDGRRFDPIAGVNEMLDTILYGILPRTPSGS